MPTTRAIKAARAAVRLIKTEIAALKQKGAKKKELEPVRAKYKICKQRLLKLKNARAKKRTGTAAAQAATPVAKKKRQRLKSAEIPLGNANEGPGMLGAGSHEPIVKRPRLLSQSSDAGVVVTAVSADAASGAEYSKNHNPNPSPSPKPDVVSGVEYRKKHSIQIRGTTENGTGAYVCPEPMLRFGDSAFGKAAIQAFANAGYEQPTPIQAQSWPITCSGRDIISVARTGSGKTAGFLMPAFEHIKARIKAGTVAPLAPTSHVTRSVPGRFGSRGRAPAQVCPCILVLAPTRELAMQIHIEARKFGLPQKVRTEVVYGGAPKRQQIMQMTSRRGGLPVHIIVATPGRLNDLVEIQRVGLKNVSMIILDEADRMLDMGFEPQLDAILANTTPQLSGAERPLPSLAISTPAARQTLFFTATWPRGVQRVADKFLFRAVQINIGNSHKLVANENIKQVVHVVTDAEKPGLLKKTLTEIGIVSTNSDPATDTTATTPSGAKCLVFVRTKRNCDAIANELWDAGFECDALHGDKEQYQRTRTLRRFERSEVKLLFATDVAARGLDVPDITHVINYDFPLQKGKAGVEDYVHRIGRTGRAGRSGTAITFFTRQNSKSAGQLMQLLRDAKQEVPAELQRMGQRFGFRGGSGGRGRRGSYGRGRGRGRGRNSGRSWGRSRGRSRW